jgi:VanZ family protein
MINKLEDNRKISLIITLLIALEIFYFSSISSSQGSGISTFDISIIYHFVIFFLFTFFLFITIKGKKEIRIEHVIIVIFISTIYSILDEIHQIFTPFRIPSTSDILINNTGILFSSFIYLYINYKNKKIKPQF